MNRSELSKNEQQVGGGRASIYNSQYYLRGLNIQQQQKQIPGPRTMFRLFSHFYIFNFANTEVNPTPIPSVVHDNSNSSNSEVNQSDTKPPRGPDQFLQFRGQLLRYRFPQWSTTTPTPAIPKLILQFRGQSCNSEVNPVIPRSILQFRGQC